MDRKNLEARAQERAKIGLERRLIPEARALLGRMYADMGILYSAGAFIPDISLYRSDWESLLARHYRRVGGEFIGIEQRSKFLTNVKQVEDEETASGILAAFLLWSKQRATQQSSFILSTTQRDMNEAIEQAKMDAPPMQVGRELNDTVAREAEKTLRKNIGSRSAVIGNVETQAPAEQAKQFTAMAVAGIPILPLQQVTVEPKRVTKEWNTVGDERVRRAHANADLQKRNQTEPFTVGGESLKYPGDTSLGASLKNIINCLHPDTRIYSASPNALTRREYSGEMITIKTEFGNKVSITPNHPVLTRRGWIPASEVEQGDSLLAGNFLKRGGCQAFDVENIMPRVAEIFDACSVILMGKKVVKGIQVNFHGERSDHDVDIVFADGLLRDRVKSAFIDPIAKLGFTSANFAESFAHSYGSSFQEFSGFLASFGGFMSRRRQLSSFFWARLGHAIKHGLRAIARLYAEMMQNFGHSPPLNFVVLGYGLNRLTAQKVGFDALNYESMLPQESSADSFVSARRSGLTQDAVENAISDLKRLFDVAEQMPFKVHLDNVISVERFHYEGPVFNLDDDKSYYIGNGIALHNCRCAAIYS